MVILHENKAATDLNWPLTLITAPCLNSPVTGLVIPLHCNRKRQWQFCPTLLCQLPIAACSCMQATGIPHPASFEIQMCSLYLKAPNGFLLQYHVWCCIFNCTWHGRDTDREGPTQFLPWPFKTSPNPTNCKPSDSWFTVPHGPLIHKPWPS